MREHLLQHLGSSADRTLAVVRGIIIMFDVTRVFYELRNKAPTALAKVAVLAVV